jgi:hypothetical protein
MPPCPGLALQYKSQSQPCNRLCRPNLDWIEILGMTNQMPKFWQIYEVWSKKIQAMGIEWQNSWYNVQ